MDYTPYELSRVQRLMVLEGVFSRAMDGLTGGVVLAGFALALGASDAVIGLLAAIPFLAQLAHIPAVALFARFPDPKPFAVYASVLARTLWLAVAAIPFLPVEPLSALLLVAVLYALVATVGGAAWQIWVRGMVGRDEIGRYFGRRLAILTGVGLATLLAAGQYLDYAGAGGHGGRRFAALFAGGALLGYASVVLLARAPTRPTARLEGPVSRALAEPFADANYRRVLVFLGAWGFAANLALPFVTVVLLSRMGLSYGTVTVLAAASLLANIAGFILWSPLTDRYGNKPVLALGASVTVATLLAWAALPKTDATLVVVTAALLHVIMGFAHAGLDVASNGLVMKLAPNDRIASYLASASVVRALTTGTAPILAGLASLALAPHALSVDLAWDDARLVTLRLAHHDFLFIGAALVGLYAVHRLLGFKEEGEAPPERVVRAMRREVGHLSSVAGMRTFAHLASYVVEAAFRFGGSEKR